jgi:uncharacterized protein YndB with AHSA1/START domain
MENTLSMITVETIISASVENVWKCWTTPADIMQWNNPFDDWHTPHVDNDLKDGGSFLFRMEKKDGSEGFDFSGKYDKVITNQLIEYTLADNRRTINLFIANGNETTIIETFDPETKTPLDIQKEFCQNVLNNFKKYAEQSALFVFAQIIPRTINVLMKLIKGYKKIPLIITGL